MSVTDTLTLSFLVTEGEVGNTLTLDFEVLSASSGGSSKPQPEDYSPFLYPEEVYRQPAKKPAKGTPEAPPEPLVAVEVSEAPEPAKTLAPASRSATDIAADVRRAFEAAEALRIEQEQQAAALLRQQIEARQKELQDEEDAIWLLLAA